MGVVTVNSITSDANITTLTLNQFNIHNEWVRVVIGGEKRVITD